MIEIEKYCTVPQTTVVGGGDEITYTFLIKNTNSTDVTLAISDIISENTEYVSGADAVEGSTLSSADVC